jgi:hypothetical protein
MAEQLSERCAGAFSSRRGRQDVGNVHGSSLHHSSDGGDGIEMRDGAGKPVIVLLK